MPLFFSFTFLPVHWKQTKKIMSIETKKKTRQKTINDPEFRLFVILFQTEKFQIFEKKFRRIKKIAKLVI